jgi:hypothetical protein
MKNAKEIREQAELQSLHYLGKYKKAVPNFRFKDFKFNESEFKIRFDLASFPFTPENILHIGDACQIKSSFYAQNSAFGQRTPQTTIETNTFVITSFVEISGKNCYAMFCALAEISDLYGKDDLRFYKIPEAIDSSLLVFWHQSIEKVCLFA